MIRVGLIGLGFMGTRHFSQYQALGDRVQVVALCDADVKRRAGDWSSVTGNLGGPQAGVQNLANMHTYERWQDIVIDKDVDMIDITLPTFLHPDVSITAMRAGKHVLCEKPMALTVAECDRMIEVSQQTGRNLMIAQCIRFWPEYVWLKQAYDELRYGKLRALTLRRQASTPDYAMGGWFLDPAKSGGAILDLHVHDIDFAIHLLGKPESVYSQGCMQNGSLDRIHALWHYDREPAVYLEGFWDYPPGFGFNMGFDVSFEKAAVTYDLVSGKPLTVFQKGCDPEHPALPEKDGYYGEIEHFISCLEKRCRPIRSTPQESRDAILIALAERRSIDIGTPVPVE